MMEVMNFLLIMCGFFLGVVTVGMAYPLFLIYSFKKSFANITPLLMPLLSGLRRPSVSDES